MTDRVPGAPGQYQAVISQEDLIKMQNNEPFVITMTRDDKPITDGTPYNKASVLPDELAALLCPEIEDPTPADALRAIQEGFGTAQQEIDQMGTEILEVQTQLNAKLPATQINAVVHFDESSDTLLNNQCVTWFNQLAPYTSGRYVVEMGTVWFINIYKTDNEYGVFERVQYKSTAANIQYASIFGGIFTGWQATLNADNWSEYISVSENGASPSGMVREFNSGAINSATYTTPGAASKFYIVTLKGEAQHISVAVDWKCIEAVGGTMAFNYVLGSGNNFSLGILNATINANNTVTFRVGSGTIVHVCGYY